MGDTRNYAALEWVIGEIEDTLKEARQALEAYVEDPKDSTRIRFCLTHIHQVHGTLQMVEFHGASLLAEEMEQLAQALIGDAVSSAAEAHEVLMRSLLQLPIYLDHVKNRRDDHPGVILPLLNDLRAVRKQGYLSETNLFAPDLTPAQHPSGARHPVTADAQKLKPVLQKLREMYQFAAASVLRGVKVEENLEYLNKVCTRLESLTAGTRSFPIWNVAAAMTEGLVRDDIELSVAVRGLLRHLARELRVLTEGSPESLNKPVRLSLLKNLLYYVARADDGGERINKIKAAYQLNTALLYGDTSGHTSDKDFISAPDPEAIRSVVVALQDEINSVKHILDISLTGQGGLDELAEVLPIVKRIADTLAVLGIGDLRKQIMLQHEALSDICTSGTLDEDRLMQVAGRIIEIEHRLQAVAKGAGKNRDLSSVDERGIEIDQAKSAVLAECQKGLEQAKDAIVEYIASKWDATHLANVSGLMNNIRGGLEMIPLPRPAAIVDTCGRYIQEQLLDAQITPDWQTLDSLADTIASVDYYLERLREDREEDLDGLLTIAQQSIGALGYAVPDTTVTSPGVVAADATDSESTQAPAEDFTETASIADERPLVDDAAVEPDAFASVAEPEVAAEQPLESEPAAESDETIGLAGDDDTAVGSEFAEPELVSETDEARHIENTADEAPAETDEPVEGGVAEASTPVAEDVEEESDIDDEIVEIFIEEAGEVQETLAEFFPLWRDNLQDQDSLTIVRRAFHTLKGSGRMVNARDIGELGWSIENMLNRVLDSTITPQDEHFALIEMVLDVLPDLVKAFEARSGNPHKALTEQYMAWAFAAADGDLPADLRRAAGRWLQGEGRSEPQESKVMEVVSADEVSPPASSVTADDSDDDTDDLVLWEIFASEAQSHLATVEAFVQQMEEAAPIYAPPSDDMQRALHTLKGSAHMAHVTPIAQLATPFESFVKELRAYQVNLNEDILQLIKDGVDYTREGLEAIEHGQQVELPKLPQFLARTAELRELAVGPLVRQKEMERDGQKQVDPRLLSIFMAEEMRLLLDADKILDRWQSNLGDRSEIAPLVAELTTLQTGATQANLPEMADLSQVLREIYHHCFIGSLEPDSAVLAELQQGHNVLLDLVDAVAAGQNLRPLDAALMARLTGFLDTSGGEAAAEEIEFSAAPNEDGGESDNSIDSGNDTSADAAWSSDTSEEFDGAALEEIDYASFATEADAEAEPGLSTTETTFELAETSGVADEWSVPEGETDLDTTEIPLYGVEEEPSSESAPETIEYALNDVDESSDHSDLTDDQADESERLPDLENGLLQDAVSEVEGDSDSVSNEFSEVPVDLADTGHQDPDLTEVEFEAAELEASELDGPELESPEVEDLSHEFGNAESVTSEDESTQAFEGDAEGADPSVEGSDLDDDSIFDGADLDLQEVDSEQLNEAFEHSSDESDLDSTARAAAEDSDYQSDNLPDVEPAAEIVVEDEQDEAAGGQPESFAAADSGPAPSLLNVDHEDYDEEIIEIFLEEADELCDELDDAINTWESDWSDSESPDTMARALHTLKGGARLAGLAAIGDLTHNYETYLLGPHGKEPDETFFKTIQTFQDKLLRNVRAVRAELAGEVLPPEVVAPSVSPSSAPSPVATADEEAAEPGSGKTPSAGDAAGDEAHGQSVSAGESPMATVESAKANVLPFAPKAKEAAHPESAGGFGSGFSMPSGGGGNQAAAQAAPRRSGPQEVIKISADLLEELVNLAGETSISRGRLETQINDLGGAIDEIDGTLSRLQEQLRRLDIETEAQMVFRQEQLAEHEEFDPLEMDRYSQLQQLSRSLIESASDLVDLKSTLTDKVKDTETLLLQQSRVNTNLQEGLMRSRMVPFSRLVPRLRRIVRQVAAELGKDVSFELENIEGEMDRSVLERMVAPLEHMLRNAVDHGIETPADRVAAGKAETGRVVLSLAREGGDVLLRLVDDGRGIDLHRVRTKAIERGLMSEDAQLTDHDIMQFILHAGFSTAENVTQISGRGVGMDVVYAEIKQLGGSMAIESREGEGTEFSVRLPFTVSVNRALMVHLGPDQYAIPLNAIEGIVRVSPFELEHYYSNPDARFEYAGDNFRVRYLGSMLSEDVRPRLEAQSLPLPVILVRSEQHTMALQVDGLMGSREIVVKSLGQQFSTVQGLSGATVMGDGSVVVILDLHALVRKEMALAAPLPVYTMDETARLAKEESEALKTVMVVDDSVTVRKVTTRFLEREGFNVITAKDGVDALRILQDETPDVMLLDIEMPRMDGFEVAKNIRTTTRWQAIPIIMITSRTGEKHREHALSLGVDRYMGKPYQEESLLASIQELLAK